MSLPVRGAWIEMLVQATSSLLLESLPVRGAWIEMSIAYHLPRTLAVSLPVRGAWIEMTYPPHR